MQLADGGIGLLLAMLVAISYPGEDKDSDLQLSNMERMTMNNSFETRNSKAIYRGDCTGLFMHV